MKNETYPFFVSLDKKQRENQCSCCGEKIGDIVSKINYIGLQDVDLVQCPVCALTSFDPIPSKETTTLGCTLLYRFQQNDTSKKKILRGFARSYRRGVRFARKYLMAIDHFKKNKERKIEILEIGAGDGYFSQGIVNCLSNAQVTYVDIVPELKDYYDQHFKNHQAIVGEFSKELVGDKKYDLIIIRDLFEHLRDPNQFLIDASQVLCKEGVLFMITPNGWEDAWPAYQYASFRDSEELQKNPYVIYLNHFHYYMPGTLEKMMKKNDFEMIKAFKYGLKRHRHGLGSKKTNSPNMIKPDLKDFKDEKSSFLNNWQHDSSFIEREILHNGSLLSRMYSMISDREKEQVPFDHPPGHEFYILAQKK